MRLAIALCGVVAAVLWTVGAVPAGAQAPLVQPAIDPNGRFTISFPADWQVLKKKDGMPAVFGIAPAGAGPRASVNVVVEALPEPLSAPVYAALSERLVAATFHDYTVVAQGPTTVGGRPAYYRYFTWETNSGVVLYEVQVFLTVGVTGFVVTGTTVNDPDRVRHDFPIIAGVIDTFRPAPPPPGLSS